MKFLKIATFALSLALMGVVATGCGGISKEAKEKLALDGAPSWILGDHSANFEVGMAKIINKDLGLAKSEATAEAMAGLVRRMDSQVLSDFSKTQSKVDESVTSEVKRIIKTVAEKMLKDVKIEKWWVNNDATSYYVLVSIDKKQYDSIVKTMSTEVTNTLRAPIQTTNAN